MWPVVLPTPARPMSRAASGLLSFSAEVPWLRVLATAPQRGDSSFATPIFLHSVWVGLSFGHPKRIIDDYPNQRLSLVRNKYILTQVYPFPKYIFTHHSAKKYKVTRSIVQAHVCACSGHDNFWQCSLSCLKMIHQTKHYIWPDWFGFEPNRERGEVGCGASVAVWNTWAHSPSKRWPRLALTANAPWCSRPMP